MVCSTYPRVIAFSWFYFFQAFDQALADARTPHSGNLQCFTRSHNLQEVVKAEEVWKAVCSCSLVRLQCYIPHYSLISFVDWAELLEPCHSMSKSSRPHEKSVK